MKRHSRLSPRIHRINVSRLMIIRQGLGVSSDSLAEAMGVEPTEYYEIEELRTEPTEEQIDKAGEFLKIPTYLRAGLMGRVSIEVSR